MSEETPAVLKPWQSLLVGAAAGIAQSVVSLPFWTMKVRQQCRLPRTMDPRILYKGFLPATFAITTMSISQVTFTTFIHRWIRSLSHTDESAYERISASLIGGTAASVIANPIGVTITQQHKAGHRSFKQGLSALTASRGWGSLYISFFCNVAINSAFTLSFYALYPLIYQAMPHEDKQAPIATFIASCCLGVVMSALLQPIDSLKTAQEYQVDEQFLSVLKQIKTIKSQRQLRALYCGFFPATVSTVSAIAAASIVLQQAEDYFLHSPKTVSP